MLEKSKMLMKAAESAYQFKRADRGQMTGADSAVNLVVALVVGGLMAAFLLPIAIDEIATVDTSSWTSGAASLWEILPVMIVLAIFLFFVGMAVRRRF
jgi:small-conductance mechanosensitive channel